MQSELISGLHRLFPDLSAWRGVPVETGMSGAVVLRLTRDGEPAQYIKAGNGARLAHAVRDEARRLAWLRAAGAPVPRVIQVAQRGDALAAMRLSALDGGPAHLSTLPIGTAATAVARALRDLHATSAAGCPFDASLAVRLAEAKANVAAGMVEAEEFDEANLGVEPAELLRRLLAMHRPVERLVVTHGDATLANVIIGMDGATGFIDCARAGLADRYQDLALMARDIRETWGQATERVFWHAYGIAHPDRDRLAYYELLEEFA